MQIFCIILTILSLQANSRPNIDEAQTLGLYSPPLKNKVSQSLSGWLASKSPNEFVKVWVFFTDKGVFTKDDYEDALKEAKSRMGAGVRKRRLKVRSEHNLVDFDDIPVYGEYIKQIEKYGAKLGVISRWLNAASFEIPIGIIDKVAKLPYVREIRKVATYKAKEEPIKGKGSINYGQSIDQLNILHVPAAHKKGYIGTGVVIGVLDAGFMLIHKSIEHLKDKVIAKYDFVRGDTTVGYDTTYREADPPEFFKHGSQMLSLIAGTKSGRLVGPAFDAYFALARTELIGPEITKEEDWWIAGVEWAESLSVIREDETLAVEIISSSLGYKTWDNAPNYSYSDMDGHTIPMSRVASSLASKGILLVNAIGNVVRETGRPDTCIVAPADADSILAVGGVYKKSVNGDTIWTWAWFDSYGSAIGPSYDGRIKPDVCGPWFAWVARQPYDPDSTNTYVQIQGTSCATALVAGLCALVLQAHPSWSPMEVREAIISTASNYGSPNDTIGYGIPNVEAAIFSKTPEVAPAPFDKDRILEIWPNPFKIGEHANINFRCQLVNDTRATMKIYTVSGRLIKEFELEDGKIASMGRDHELIWDGNISGSTLASGIYICLLKTGYGYYVKKFAVVR